MKLKQAKTLNQLDLETDTTTHLLNTLNALTEFLVGNTITEDPKKFLFNKSELNNVEYDPQLYKFKVEHRELVYNKADGLPELVGTGKERDLFQEIQDQNEMVLKFNAIAMNEPYDPNDMSYFDTTIFSGSKYDIKKSLSDVKNAEREFNNLPSDYKQKYNNSFTKFINEYETHYNEYQSFVKTEQAKKQTEQFVNDVKDIIKADKEINKEANNVIEPK